MKLFRLLASLAVIAPAMAKAPFDLGLPSFSDFSRMLPMPWENLVEVDVTQERFSINVDIEGTQKPPQLFYSPLLSLVQWPDQLARDAVAARYRFVVGSDGIPRDIRRLTENLHRDLDLAGAGFIAHLRYSPALIKRGAVECPTEVELRFRPSIPE